MVATFWLLHFLLLDEKAMSAVMTEINNIMKGKKDVHELSDVDLQSMEVIIFSINNLN